MISLAPGNGIRRKFWKRSREMLPTPDRPKLPAQTRSTQRGARILLTSRGYPLADLASWLAWLLVVVVFAVWTLAHYSAPTGPQWIGMTIHTGVFAIWTLVARTWLSIYLTRRWGNHPSRKTDKESDS
jgi:hypothetical protein